MIDGDGEADGEGDGLWWEQTRSGDVGILSSLPKTEGTFARKERNRDFDHGASRPDIECQNTTMRNVQYHHTACAIPSASKIVGICTY